VLKLSEAFKDVAPGAPALELVVQVYNINRGHNDELITRSETLGGYSTFVGKVREYERSMPLEAAMKEAIKYCIENGVLKTFLETHSSEVFNMLITEWNLDEAKEAWYEEGREEGREEGIEDIARNALAEGLSVDVVKKITGLDMETIKSL
jgi:predicted transposase/invertase (TIGR01784 family)